MVVQIPPESLDDADAEGVRVPGCAADSLPEDDPGLIGVSETLAENGRCDLRTLGNDVAAEVAEQKHSVCVRVVLRHELRVDDRIPVDLFGRHREAGTEHARPEEATAAIDEFADVAFHTSAHHPLG